MLMPSVVASLLALPRPSTRSVDIEQAVAGGANPVT